MVATTTLVLAACSGSGSPDTSAAPGTEGTTTRVSVPVTTRPVLPTATTRAAVVTTTTLPAVRARVEIEIVEESYADPDIDVVFNTVELVGLPNADAEARINISIIELVRAAVDDFVLRVQQSGIDQTQDDGPSSMGMFATVRLLNDEVLSLRFDEGVFYQGSANGSAAVKTLSLIH